MNPASQLSAPLSQASVSLITLVSDKPLAPAARLAYQFGLDGRLGLFNQERHGSLCQDVLKSKTAPLLDEYFSLRLLDETLKCIGELKFRAQHPEIVKEAIPLD